LHFNSDLPICLLVRNLPISPTSPAFLQTPSKRTSYSSPPPPPLFRFAWLGFLFLSCCIDFLFFGNRPFLLPRHFSSFIHQTPPMATTSASCRVKNLLLRYNSGFQFLNLPLAPLLRAELTPSSSVWPSRLFLAIPRFPSCPCVRMIRKRAHGIAVRFLPSRSLLFPL